MYIPSMKSIPLHEEKGEAQISLGTSTNSVYLSGDYAFSNKLALQVNGNLSFHNFSSTYDIFTDENTDRIGGMFTPDYDYGEFSHKYGEIGLGRYDILKSDWKLEAFVGTGYGFAYDAIVDIDSYYYLGYIQGNFGRKVKNRNFEFGFACRMDYSNLNVRYIEPGLTGKTKSTFDNIGIEPAAFFRLGSNSLRFFTQVGFNYLYSFDSYSEIDLPRGIKDGELNYTSLHIVVGVNCKFGKRKEKAMPNK